MKKKIIPFVILNPSLHLKPMVQKPVCRGAWNWAHLEETVQIFHWFYLSNGVICDAVFDFCDCYHPFSELLSLHSHLGWWQSLWLIHYNYSAISSELVLWMGYKLLRSTHKTVKESYTPLWTQIAEIKMFLWHNSLNQNDMLSVTGHFPAGLCECAKQVEGYRAQNKLKGRPLDIRGWGMTDRHLKLRASETNG